MTKNPKHVALSLVRSGALEATLDAYLDGWAAREREVCTRGGARLPPATIQELRASRVLAAPIPRALGGAGADLTTTVRAVRRVAQRAPCTALCMTMPLGNAANARVLDEHVAPSLRPQLASGRAFLAERALAGEILAVANSEPGAGGDLANTRTRAVRGDDGVVRLAGQKSFATLGPDADYFLCSARTPEGTIDAYFVASDAAGVSLSDDWDPIGMRATASVGLALDEAPVAAPFLYPGAIVSVNARHWSTLLMGAVFVGIGEGALAAALACAPRTSGWARATLADCALTLDAAAGFLDAVAGADALPASPELTERCRRAKTFAARTAVDVSSRCMTIAGGRAYRAEHALARAWLDAAAGPSLRPPVAHAMDGMAAQLFGDG